MIRYWENFGQQHFHDTTLISPLSATIVLIAVISTLTIRRNYALIPFILALCIIPYQNQIAILTIDFSINRIILIALAVRTIIRDEAPKIDSGNPEKLIIFFITSFTLISALSSGNWLLNIGRGVNLILLAFVIRTYLDISQFKSIISSIGLISIPCAFAFWIEHTTLQNAFQIFGGVPSAPEIRNGEVRAQGPIGHPIYAGVLWATFSNFFIWRLIVAKSLAGKLFWLTAISSAIFICISTSSSTPILGLIAIFSFWLCYLLRNYRHLFLPTICLVILFLHSIMQAPVWHLISRVGTSEGSTSHFRFQLVDSFIRNIDEWFIFGTNTTAHWFWGAQDLVNQFVYLGVKGGALTLILFLLLELLTLRKLSYLFGKLQMKNDQDRWMIWSLLVSLNSSMVMFFGTSYIGKIELQLYFIIFGALAIFRRYRLEEN